MTTMHAPAPWAKYRTHAAQHAYKTHGGIVHYQRTHTPLSSGEWAQQMRKSDPVHRVRISEAHHTNDMQSAPHVLFATYDARNQYGYAPHSRITKTHPYIITTYTEGDLSNEFYATEEARDRALFLLERAL